MPQLRDAERLMLRALGAAPPTGSGTQFIAVASQAGLRWIIPANLGAASPALAHWRPYKLASRLAWRGIQIASRAGALSAVPGARSFGVDLTGVVWSKFGWSIPNPPLVIAYVGTVGPHQKLVCNFIDSTTGQTALVVKFPVVETAKACLRREFETLGKLIEEARDIGPKPLLIDEHTRFTVQSFLKGRPDGVAIGGQHLAFLASLVQSGEGIRLEAVRNDLRRRSNELAAAGALNGAKLGRVDSILDTGAWDQTVPSVRTHGDFAPWNLKRDQEGAVRAVDWEDSVESALPYLDLHHYRHSLSKTLGRTCAVPWDAYTAALSRADPAFSGARAMTAYLASALSYWLSSGCTSEWDFQCR